MRGRMLCRVSGTNSLILRLRPCLPFCMAANELAACASTAADMRFPYGFFLLGDWLTLLLLDGMLPLETVRITIPPSTDPLVLCKENGRGEDSPGYNGLGRGVRSIMALSAGEFIAETEAGDRQSFMSSADRDA